jgi:hypothetical protein
MSDTSKHIYDMQLKLWLAKSPMERLHQLMLDNEALFKFWREARPVNNRAEKVLIAKTIIQSNIENPE